MKTLKNHIDTWGALGVFAALFALTMLLFALLARSAHADPVLPPVAVASFSLSALPWEAWFVGGLAALAGLETALKGLAMAVRAFSKLTKTTADDAVADKLEAADAHFVDGLNLIRGLRPGAAPVPKPPLAPVAMLAVLLLGAGAMTMAQGCGGTMSSRAATIGSLNSGVRAATVALRTYEHVRADAVIASATSLEIGRNGLAALRVKTAPAWKAVDTAIAALDAANTLNDDPSLAGAQVALDNAITAIAALTGGSK